MLICYAIAAMEDAVPSQSVKISPTIVDAREIIRVAKRSLDLKPGEHVSPATLVRLLRTNKFPLLSLAWDMHDPHALSLRQSDEFKTALDEQRALYEQLHGEWVRLAKAWERAGVRHTCFKSVGIAPSFPYTSDNTDVLIPAANVEEARRVLLHLDYVELRNTEEPRKWLFRRFVAGQSVSAIHLHAAVTWRGGFMLENELWTRVRQSPDDPWTWVPGWEDAVLINIAHALIENKGISLHDLVKIHYALDRRDVDWDYMDHIATTRGWCDCLHFGLLLVAQLEDQLYGASSIPPTQRERYERTVRNHIWLGRYWSFLRRRSQTPLPFNIFFPVGVALYFHKVWGDQRLKAAEKPRQTVVALAQGFAQRTHLHLQNAMLFALSGMDGSGKSTLAQALHSAFETSGVRARVAWKRIGDTPLLHVLRMARWQVDRYRWKRAQRKQGGMESAEPPKRSFNRRGIWLIIWAIVATIDYAVWLQHVRWQMIRGRVVIADRYLCDFDVELNFRLREHPRLARALLWLLQGITPQPERSYLLRIPPEVSIDRKSEPDFRNFSLEYAAQAYDRLINRYCLHPIDTTKPLEEVASALVHDSLTTYMENFGTFLRTFIFANPWQLNPGSRQHSAKRHQ
jgi:thymidylate kinase